MEINKEDCKYFYWISQISSCCGRKTTTKNHGTCGTEKGNGRMCNTSMYYCTYEKREDESNSEL